MITCKLHNGLGNQMFQIAATYAHAKRNGDTAVFDLSNWIGEYQGHSPVKYQSTLLKNVPHGTVQGDIWVEGETDNMNDLLSVYPWKPIPYWKDTTLYGRFQSEKFFEDCKEDIRNLFTLNKEIEKTDEDPEITAVCVRRGDYLTLPYYTRLQESYYREAMEVIGSDKPFVFVSDDINWCKETFQGDNIYYSPLTDDVDNMTLIATCQPPGTKVFLSDFKEIPIESIKIGDRVVTYSNEHGKYLDGLIWKSGRGSNGRTVKNIIKSLYNGDLVVATSAQKITKYTTNHHCIVRIGEAFYNKYIVYVMKKGNRYRVGITTPAKTVRGRKTTDRIGMADVRVRVSQEGADCAWIITACNILEEALIEESYISCKFSMPQVRFVEGDKKNEKSKRWIDGFWKRFGENDLKQVINCLEYYGRDIRYPFVYGGKRVNLCKNQENVMMACNLFSGMKVLHSDIYMSKNNGKGDCPEAWKPIEISREWYNGYVYSLTVDGNHTYIADGIVTHNCTNVILANSTFGWWGAWLGEDEYSKIIGPDKWFTEWCNDDIMPDRWIKISV